MNCMSNEGLIPLFETKDLKLIKMMLDVGADVNHTYFGNDGSK